MCSTPLRKDVSDLRTIQELYDEIMANGDLKARFIEAAKAGKQEAFLKEQGCEATMEEVAAFLKAKGREDAPLSLDQMENTAGGACNGITGVETVLSVFGVAGLLCAGLAIASAAGANGKHVGQQNDEEGRLCNK